MTLRLFRTFTVQLIHRRFYKKQPVRVRFAPSPTGQLHLGGLRTALYNYLFARQNGGSFILRIEDTDQTRLEVRAMEKLQEDLLWTGIIPDEGPTTGGPNGPYIQSKRLNLYREQVEKLLENGSAYYCFCSERRLEMLRKEAIKAGEIPKYDNRCRHLEKDVITSKLSRQEPHCIRFKLPDTLKTFHDLVYGDVSISQAEGDPVIIKSDGFPTYHFANVVDDHFMEISHVLRGVEWQISTPKHLEMYYAFGWTPPQFGHLPLILNANGTKLSKRQGDIKVESFRKDGIFPLALLNYITYAGGGFRREDGFQDVCHTYVDLIKQFDIDRINTSSSRLHHDKLMEFNKLELSNLLDDSNNMKFLVQKLQNLVLEAFPDRRNDGSLQLDEHHMVTILEWARNRITKLTDLISTDLAFLWVTPTLSKTIEDPETLGPLRTLYAELQNLDTSNFEKDQLNDYLRKFAKDNGLKFSTLMKSLRTVLSGLQHGPAVAEMMEILGKDKTLDRLKHCHGQ
ncbi:probable glutamate--tRNA ligase, mitochondrial [Diachasma alloeum]|uniref:probable glutamate--tRNA ligase, mitochondrial n=1 Tax=Diachasma alloeum TaxID=454923 RepID=UPI000738271B|nr:probable glutamate--tRNA ligase, mitochondrial [Diachasma alloeum]